MGATVSHRPSLVMYFQVSVVDQVLVFEPREPPVRRDRSRLSIVREHQAFFTKKKLCSKSSVIFLLFITLMAFKGLRENRLTCDIHIIVQGDHGVAPLVWVGEIWELMPLLCREKETVYLVFLSVEGQKNYQRSYNKSMSGAWN